MKYINIINIIIIIEIIIIILYYLNYVEKFTTQSMVVYTNNGSTRNGIYGFICQEYRNSCPAGQELTDGTITSDKTCTDCQSGHYKDLEGPQDCVSYSDITSCPAGQELTGGTITSDNTCTDCQRGYYKYRAGNHPCMSCESECGKVSNDLYTKCIWDDTSFYAESAHGKCSKFSENIPVAGLDIKTALSIYIPKGRRSIAIYDNYNYSGNCYSKKSGLRNGLRLKLPKSHRKNINSIKIDEEC